MTELIVGCGSTYCEIDGRAKDQATNGGCKCLYELQRTSPEGFLRIRGALSDQPGRDADLALLERLEAWAAGPEVVNA